VSGVAISADGKRIVSGSQDRTVRVWDTASGQELLSLKGHTQPVTSLALSADGNCIVSGGEDNTLRVWDTQTAPELIDARKRQHRDEELLRRWSRFDPAWHSKQAHASEDAGDLFAATFHLDRLALHQPLDASLHIRLAHFHAHQNHPDRAALHLCRALLLNPRVSLWPVDPEAARRGHVAADAGDWKRAVRLFEVAAQQPQAPPNSVADLFFAQSALGDQARYRATAADMLRRFPQAWHAEMTWILSTVPLDRSDALRLVASTRELLTRQRSAASLLLHGEALYRAGRHHEALRVLTGSLALQSHGNALIRAGKQEEAARLLLGSIEQPTWVDFMPTYVFMALNSRALDRHDEAKHWLTLCKGWFEKKQLAQWQHRVHYRLLLAEARQKINSPPAMPRVP
jgi:tetratricopeptide (TPR) repeat protein